MDNEVIIHVRVKNEGKTGFEAVQKNADESARTVSNSFSEKLSTSIRDTLLQKLRAKLTGAGSPTEVIGTTLGDKISERMSERITNRIYQDARGRWRNALMGSSSGGDGGRGGRGGEGGNGGDANVTVDVDKQSLLQRLFGAGKDGAARFADGFKSGLSSIAGGIFSGDIISTLLKGLSVAGLVSVLAPVLGAAVTTALGLALGGGAIAIGIAGAFKDPRIQAAAKEVLGQLTAMFADFSENFKEPLMNFFKPGAGAGLVGVIQQIRQSVHDLGENLGPVADKLGNGIIGFLQNALPGLIRAVDNSRPIVEALAEKLPKIGAAIGRLFDRISDKAPEASVFFRDLLDGIVAVIDIVGILIAGFTDAYMIIRTIFTGLVEAAYQFLDAAAAAFGWLPGIGPKLQTAANKTKEFRDRMNNNLRGIDKDVTISVRFRVFGQAVANAAVRTARLLDSMGYAHGGIVGAATGGLHSGLRMVGEHGPELVDLPAGSRVHSNPDTERMLSGGGGGVGTLVLQLAVDGRVLAESMVEPTRELVRSLGAGSVQRYYGQAGIT
jgi:hypothetical protein